MTRWPTAAPAATLEVSNCNDDGAGSFRQALANAASGDSIGFELSPACDLITLTSGEITIAQNVDIAGPGAGALAVSGDDLRGSSS
jgi:hypothetical protein